MSANLKSPNRNEIIFINEISLTQNSFGQRLFFQLQQLQQNVFQFQVQKIKFIFIYKIIKLIFFKALQYDVSVYDEIVVKWFEMAQLGLPSATLSAFVGSFKLNCQEKQKLIETLPDILKRANKSEFIMNVYFEEHINTDITQLRKSLRLL